MRPPDRPARLVLAATFAAFIAGGCGPVARDAAARALTREGELEDQGWTRTYRLHVPPGPHGPLPLLVVLHGGGGSGAQIEEVSGFSGIADREGFVVVYPDGIAGAPHGFARAWNSGDCCGVGHLLGVDDVRFLRALVVDIERRIPIDRDRVFVAGWSNGAALAYLAGMRLADLVAGIGPYAASMRARGPLEAPRFDAPVPTPPVSVFAVHAKADPRVPYAGRDDGDTVEVPFREAGRFWAVAAGCTGRAAPRYERDGAVRFDEYRGCKRGAEVTFVTLEGWGHDWPGPAYTDRLPPAHPLRGWDVAEAMWAFFAKHGRGGTGRAIAK